MAKKSLLRSLGVSLGLTASILFGNSQAVYAQDAQKTKTEIAENQEFLEYLEKSLSGSEHYQSVKDKLNDKTPLTKSEHQQRRRYAVILNGDLLGHGDNVEEAYKTLNHSGFEDKNLFILSRFLPEDIGKESVTGMAYQTNLREVFNYLERTVDKNDLFVIYATGHAELNGDRARLQLAFEPIDSADFKKIVEKIKAQDYIFVTDTCYSGTIAKELSNLEGNVLSISSTDAEHVTYCKSFIVPFWRVLRNGEGAREADANMNRKVDIGEAFNYAFKKHREDDKLDKKEAEKILKEHPEMEHLKKVREESADAQFYCTKNWINELK